MTQKAEELYEDGWCTFQTTVFSRWTGVYGLKHTETGNVLETGFQRQFPNRNVHYCRRSCSNLNHTGHNAVHGHTYYNCPLLYVCLVIRKLPLKPSDCFQNITGFWIVWNHKHLFIFMLDYVTRVIIPLFK